MKDNVTKRIIKEIEACAMVADSYAGNDDLGLDHMARCIAIDIRKRITYLIAVQEKQLVNGSDGENN